MPNFIVIIGPQAVGKMAVGNKLAERLNYKFSHNHHSIEFGLQFYEYGTPEFVKINRGIRKLLFDTMIEFENVGFVFTYVVAFNFKKELEDFKSLLDYFRDKNWTPLVVELTADLETRLARNKTEERLKAKASKRDVKQSEQRLLKSLEKYVLNSSDEYPFPYSDLELDKKNYFLLNNTNLTVETQLQRIIEYYSKINLL